jgi:Sulfotransferase family
MTRQDRYEALRRELDADQLIQAARDRAGLSDFGDNHFVEPLNKLLDCAASEVDFHVQGLEGFKSSVVRWLVNRLRMEDDIKKHPEILQEDVSDPIIITGLGRSGTTKLHKMLSAPDSVQKTLFWRIWNPARFPDAVAGQPDPRIAAAGSSNLVSADNPVMDAAHHIEEQEVEEEWVAYMMTFQDWSWNVMLPTPAYFDWVMSQPSIEPFRYMKTVLQYLQWQDGGRAGKLGRRPWILKNVAYITNIDSLLACYPNATLVHAHRDPRANMPSWAKLMSASWSVHCTSFDPHFLGAEAVRNWSVAMSRYLEMRDRLKLDDRILDVNYDTIRQDPMSVIKKIYHRAGLNMSAETEQKMAQWHATNEQGRYGKHEYSLEEFGMSEASVDQAFAEYIRRFIKR